MNGKDKFIEYKIELRIIFRTPRGERRHYISKGCDTRDSCTRRK
jgi:hypothetical protein